MSEIVFTELRQFNSGINFIFAIKKFNGLIFFSTNKSSGGEVWTYNPITGRFLLNSTFPAGDSVRDFLVMPSTTNANFTENTLYAVTGGTDGKLYIYDNDGTWTELADSGDSQINSLVFYKENLYYGTNGDEVFKWDGSAQTISLTAAETAGDVTALFVFDELMFAGTIGAKIFVFDNSSWSLEDTLSDTGVTKILCFEEFNGDLYAGTNKTTTGNNLWKRDLVSPVNWVAVTSLDDNELQTMEVFFDKLYMGTGTDDSIQRYDGTNFDTIKPAVTGIAGYDNNASFADGSDCLYFGSRADSNTVGLFAMCPRCSDQLLISGASPFGWNVGDCDITPEICLIEDGCFCQILNTGDTTTIQIQWNGPGTPYLAISDTETGVESSITAFVNIVGNVWEIEIDLTGLNSENIQFIVTTRTGTDEGEWVDISIGGSDLEDVHVSSLTRVYICGAFGGSILKSSSDQGDAFSNKTAPATGTGGVHELSMRGANENTLMVARGNGFGYSTDGLTSYVNDVSHTAGGPVVMDALNAANVLVVNQNGAARISPDNGATWGALGNDPPTVGGNYQAVYMTSTVVFFVCGLDFKIYSTTDGGATAWVLDHTDTESLRGLHMQSSTVGWCVGDNGTILKTTDGSTWLAQTSGTAEQLNKVWFMDSNTGWIVGENGIILKTINGGTTWTIQTPPSSANLNNVNGFLSGNNIFVVAVGDSGAIFRLNDAIAGGSDFAITECIKIKNDFDCGLLVKYTNDDNFADFNYENGLVNQIRLKAHFWKVDNPTEEAIQVTSAEEIIPTRQVVKKQILLETDIMPVYMHEKLSIIFKHAAIEIDGITYVAEGGYEHDPYQKNFSQVKGHVTLTDKTYTKENIF